MIGKSNLAADSSIAHWAPPKEDTKDQWGEARKGSIKVLRTTLQAVQQVSIKEGVILRPAAIDGSTEVYPMPRKAKKSDAVEPSELLGTLSYGVVPFVEGYAVRYEKGKDSRSKPSWNRI